MTYGICSAATRSRMACRTSAHPTCADKANHRPLGSLRRTTLRSPPRIAVGSLGRRRSGFDRSGVWQGRGVDSDLTRSDLTPDTVRIAALPNLSIRDTSCGASLGAHWSLA